jgi:hypothetical protein
MCLDFIAFGQSFQASSIHLSCCEGESLDWIGLGQSLFNDRIQGSYHRSYRFHIGSIVSHDQVSTFKAALCWSEYACFSSCERPDSSGCPCVVCCEGMCVDSSMGTDLASVGMSHPYIMCSAR